MEYSGFSHYHFHRLFCAYVGESVKQYILRIRLEFAAYQLRHMKHSITLVSQEAGYNSPASFSKAFKDLFGTNPKGFKKIDFIMKEGLVISPKEIITIESIPVYSVRHVGPYMEVGKAFEKLMKFAYTQKIKYKKNLMGKDAYTYGLTYDDPWVTASDKLRSDACVSADDDVELEEGIERREISAGKYAMFVHKGPYSDLKDTFRGAYAWIKNEGIELRDVPNFEKYFNRDPRRTKPENLKTEVYIPIV